MTTFKLNTVQLFPPTFQPLLVYVLYTCLLPICCQEKKNSELFIARSLTPKHESSLRTGGVKVRPMSSSPHKIKQIKGWIGGGGSTAGPSSSTRCNIRKHMKHQFHHTHLDNKNAEMCCRNGMICLSACPDRQTHTVKVHTVKLFGVKQPP